MTGTQRALLLVLALASCLACATTSLERRPWLRQRTTNFDVRSSLGEQATAKLVRDLESFVAACEGVYGANLSVATPIRVYAHDGKGLQRPFERGNQPAWFASATGAAVLVLRGGRGFADAGPEERSALARHLSQARGALDAPLWYDEGVAAFLGTARTGPRQTVLGEPRFDLLEQLRDQIWPPLEAVLAVGSLDDASRRERAVFRARAWVVVHYALLGELPHATARAALDLSRARSLGTAATPEAWFGVDADDFETGIQRHAADPGRGRLAVRSVQPTGSTPEPLSCSQVGNALGWLALELERDGLARRYYLHAGRCDPSSSAAHAGLAVAESLRGDFETARELREIALSASPEDPQVLTLAGSSLDILARESRSDTSAQPALAEARRHYERAARLAPDDPAPLERLGRSVLGDPSASQPARERALAALREAQGMRPAALDLALDRARARADLGERSYAGELARIISARAEDDELRRAALALSSWSERPVGRRP